MMPLDLLYLYVGSDDVGRDLRFYCDTLGGTRVFDFERFGTRVAAVRLGAGPLWLIAGHRPAPSVLPIFAVANLDSSIAVCEAAGYPLLRGPLEVPNGPAAVFRDPSGNEFALLQNDRPNALEDAYGDPTNPHALH